MKRLIAVLALVAAGCGGTEEEQQGSGCYDYEATDGAWSRYCLPEGFTGEKFCYQTNEPCRQDSGEVSGEVIRCTYVKDIGDGVHDEGYVASTCVRDDWDCRDDIVNPDPCCEPGHFAMCD